MPENGNPLVTLEGRVRYADGSAAPDALVSWLRYDGPEEGVEQRMTHTDARGRFAIEVPARFWPYSKETLLVSAPGSALSLQAVERDVAIGDIAPPTAVSLKVSFLSPDGHPLRNLKVGLLGLMSHSCWLPAPFPIPDGPEISARSDVDGVASFAGLPRAYHVLLNVEDAHWARPTHPEALIALSDTAEVTHAEIRLSLAAAIHGRVVNEETGAPEPGVKVAAQEVHGGGFGFGEAVTDGDGRYEILQLKHGQYVISIRSCEVGVYPAPEWTARASEGIFVTEGAQTEVEDLVLTRGALISGRVFVRGSDEPLPAVYIGAVSPAHPSTASGAQGVVTDEDGRYTLRVPGGQIRLTVALSSSSGYRLSVIEGQSGSLISRQLVVREGAAVREDFPLQVERPRFMSGRVIGPDGRPAPGAELMIFARSDDGLASNEDLRRGRSYQRLTDGVGAFRVETPTDAARIFVRARGAGLIAREARAVTLPADEEVILILDEGVGSAITGAVVNSAGAAISGASVFLELHEQGIGFPYPKIMTGPNGRFAFHDLWSDLTYTVTAYHPGFERVRIQNISPGIGDPKDLGEIRLSEAAHSISGLILDDKANPISGAHIMVRGIRTYPQEGTSGADGGFHINGVAQETVDVSVVYHLQHQRIRAEAGSSDLVLKLRK